MVRSNNQVQAHGELSGQSNKVVLSVTSITPAIRKSARVIANSCKKKGIKKNLTSKVYGIDISLPSTSRQSDLVESGENVEEWKWICSDQITARNPVPSKRKRESRTPAKYQDDNYDSQVLHLRELGPKEAVQYEAKDKNPIPPGINYVRDPDDVKEGVWPVIAVMDETNDQYLCVFDHFPRVETYERLLKSKERNGGSLMGLVSKDTIKCKILIRQYNLRKLTPRQELLGEERSDATLQELYYESYSWYDKELGTGGVSCEGGEPLESDVALSLVKCLPAENRGFFNVVEDTYTSLVKEGHVGFAYDFKNPDYDFVFLALIFRAWACLTPKNAVFIPIWMGKTSVRPNLVEKQENGAIDINPYVKALRPVTPQKLRTMVNVLRRDSKGVVRDVLFIYLNSPGRNNRRKVRAHAYLCIVSDLENVGRITYVIDPAIDQKLPVPRPIRKLNEVLNGDKSFVVCAHNNQGEFDSACLLRSLRLMSLCLGGLPWKDTFVFNQHPKRS